MLYEDVLLRNGKNLYDRRLTKFRQAKFQMYIMSNYDLKSIFRYLRKFRNGNKNLIKKLMKKFHQGKFQL